MYLTYRFRIKDATSGKYLDRMAYAVNAVWNYCNETAILALRRDGKWINKFALMRLTAGCSSELGLRPNTIQRVCSEYHQKRLKFKKPKLAWRGRRSPGWIPFRNVDVQVGLDEVVYDGHRFRFWDSRAVWGAFKCGSFAKDPKGHWHVNLRCWVCSEQVSGCREIGIDLGLKEIVTCSDGWSFSRESYTRKMAHLLAMAQRAHKRKQVLAIHTKIKNARLDWSHKVTSELLKGTRFVALGGVSAASLIAQHQMPKAISDAAWGLLRQLLSYKAERQGTVLQVVNEAYSTQTCSTCLERAGPKGSAGLSVRDWVCRSCGTRHQRDVNAARNILREGLLALNGGPSAGQKPKDTGGFLRCEMSENRKPPLGQMTARELESCLLNLQNYYVKAQRDLDIANELLPVVSPQAKMELEETIKKARYFLGRRKSVMKDIMALRDSAQAQLHYASLQPKPRRKPKQGEDVPFFVGAIVEGEAKILNHHKEVVQIIQAFLFVMEEI